MGHQLSPPAYDAEMAEQPNRLTRATFRGITTYATDVEGYSKVVFHHREDGSAYAVYFTRNKEALDAFCSQSNSKHLEGVNALMNEYNEADKSKLPIIV